MKISQCFSFFEWTHLFNFPFDIASNKIYYIKRYYTGLFHIFFPMNTKKIDQYKLFALKGFTLVEIIIVITILAVLSTMGVMSYTWYNSSSRDAVRTVDIGLLKQSLEWFKTVAWKYPMPENQTGTGTIYGEEFSYLWVIGDNISGVLKINKTPVDPLSKTNYVYAVTNDRAYYQIATVLENTQSYNPIISQTYADSNYKARVVWNYDWILKFNDWTNTWLINTPSLVFNTQSGNTVDLLSTGTYFVVNELSNLPYPIGDLKQINNKNGAEVIREISKTSVAYLTGINITEVVNNTKTIDQVFGTGYTLESQAIFASFWMNSYTNNGTIDNWPLSTLISGEVSPSWPNVAVGCNANNYLGYTIDAVDHGKTQIFNKPISNGATNIAVTCTNGVLSYGSETLTCNQWYAQQASTCILADCSGTIPASVAASNATSTSWWSWHYDVNPWNCTYACNANYVGISNVCYSKCWIDQYRANPTNTTCTSVGSGYYSPDNNDARNSCTGLPANAVFSSAWGGTDSCTWTCNNWYTRSGDSCVVVCWWLWLCSTWTNTFDDLANCGATRHWTCSWTGFSQACSAVTTGGCK